MNKGVLRRDPQSTQLPGELLRNLVSFGHRSCPVFQPPSTAADDGTKNISGNVGSQIYPVENADVVLSQQV